MNHNLIATVYIKDTPIGGTQGTLSSYTNISQVTNPLLKNSLTIAGIIFVVLIIAGGIGMIASAGKNDPKKAEASQKTITSAIIGFVVVFCAYFIIQIIEVLTGANILGTS
jgi:Na+-driven multidrug efflux pump